LLASVDTAILARRGRAAPAARRAAGRAALAVAPLTCIFAVNEG
jgi:hypothetical protein